MLLEILKESLCSSDSVEMLDNRQVYVYLRGVSRTRLVDGSGYLFNKP